MEKAKKASAPTALNPPVPGAKARFPVGFSNRAVRTGMEKFLYTKSRSRVILAQRAVGNAAVLVPGAAWVLIVGRRAGRRLFRGEHPSPSGNGPHPQYGRVWSRPGGHGPVLPPAGAPPPFSWYFAAG